MDDKNALAEIRQMVRSLSDEHKSLGILSFQRKRDILLVQKALVELHYRLCMKAVESNVVRVRILSKAGND
jgi:hypothetical protein